MSVGKSINLFLMDGTASGRIKCTLANWTGMAYKIPRTEVENCSERQDLSQSGVYFLFGVSEESGANLVYVGQAGVRKNGEGLLYRLREHKRSPDKDYWTEAVVFTTSNNSFGPTEISYLENRFCAMAVAAKRYIVKNGNDPTCGNITEEKESELEEFIEYAKIVMGTLGHKVFEPLAEIKTAASNSNVSVKNERVLYLKQKINKSGLIIEASCKQTAEGFVVLAGSRIEKSDSDILPNTLKEIRRKSNIDENGILQEQVLFKSPTYAAMFVLGKSSNGLISWKTDEGVTLKDTENIKEN